ncbi:hypothetical protein SAMN05428944_1935 [Streptomyces sp. 1222.5]|nr:hypothetical protein BX260_6157 [Streptomyces sp. 5112.2]SEB94524.1 hypothetical protein SAMN05428944_1935 [Streptomyces sp. 1222.5]
MRGRVVRGVPLPRWSPWLTCGATRSHLLRVGGGEAYTNRYSYMLWIRSSRCQRRPGEADLNGSFGCGTSPALLRNDPLRCRVPALRSAVRGGRRRAGPGGPGPRGRSRNGRPPLAPHDSYRAVSRPKGRRCGSNPRHRTGGGGNGTGRMRARCTGVACREATGQPCTASVTAGDSEFTSIEGMPFRKNGSAGGRGCRPFLGAGRFVRPSAPFRPGRARKFSQNSRCRHTEGEPDEYADRPCRTGAVAG